MTRVERNAPEVCELIRQLEELEGCPVAAVVLVKSDTHLGFVMPSELSTDESDHVLRVIASAAQDALKSR